MAIAVWKLVENWYQDLPAKYKALAFFFALACGAYLLLLPQFIDGELVQVVENAEIPFSDVRVAITVDGRTMKMTTNEDGRWALPVASKIPLASLEMKFHVDGKWYPVRVSFGKVVSGSVKVVYSDTPRTSFAVADTASIERIADVLMPVAYAAPPGSGSVTDQPRPSAPDGDDQASLLKVVRKAARRPDAPIDGAMLLRRDLRLNDAGMAYLKYLVDKELLQKTTSSEAWKDVRTVEELTAFVRRQR